MTIKFSVSKKDLCVDKLWSSGAGKRNPGKLESLKRGENLRLKRDAARREKKKRESLRCTECFYRENVALTQQDRREKMFLVNIVLFRRSRDEG
ncbi:hypothetical protein WN51_08982 [Melipona quadrifasciata]|uniref:Uncharacterized protein n=1 Tax=Melipona quadrifasciata TaxID=166423 RepID=A0A0N0U795_9HYME|nr:hypothetical protein WN51_08982 [Melipona quadrifasciata]